MAELRALAVCAVVLVHALVTRAVREPHCAAYEDEVSATSGLKFVTQSLYSSYITCDGYHTELWCCTLGYTQLIWQKLLTTSGQWYTIPEGRQRFTQENNQTLVMNYVTPTYDETKFRCTARNESGYEISNTIDLVIRACETWDESPIPIQPAPGLRLLRLPGASITLPCEGVFGPDYTTERRPANLTWRRDSLSPDGIVTSSITWVAGIDNGTADGRISITFSEEQRTMTSDLHVTNVSGEDYGNYTCIMANSIGRVSRVISLKEGDPNAITIISILVVDQAARTVALTIGLVMILTLAVVVVYFAFGLDIRLYYKDRFKRPIDPTKCLDAFVLHTELCAPDQQFVVQQLRPYLEDEHHYKLYIAERDSIPGEPSINKYMSQLESSQCMLVLVSDDTLADEWCRFILNYALGLESRNIVFLLYRKVTTWTDSREDVTLRRAIKVASHKVAWPALSTTSRCSSIAPCLTCHGTDGSRRRASRQSPPDSSATERGELQESSSRVAYVGDTVVRNGTHNAYRTPSSNHSNNIPLSNGVHTTDSSRRDSQRALSDSEQPRSSPSDNVDSSSSSEITTYGCCCPPCTFSDPHTPGNDESATPPGRRPMSAREARFWKQLRLVLPPRVHRPEFERSESTVTDTATLTANII